MKNYGVFIPSKKKPIMRSDCLRSCEQFANEGYTRCIFDLRSGKQLNCGGVIGVDLKEFLRGAK